ncbi:hypothetical protein [Dyadobacter sp. CY323]|uniref:hypothetical protein n=1 Tax=Dyadobacter sp. CY323 TaxID=2907302 RepID=UPI001F48C7DE|nr:hypothetical protein [Dyadobacter sp. CY323]MCE6992079.1 hypothetical protein [Dyadobacter sp. CY323]
MKEKQLQAEIKDLKAQIERLQAEKSFEAKLKNQAWFFINQSRTGREFDQYKLRHPVQRPSLVKY